MERRRKKWDQRREMDWLGQNRNGVFANFTLTGPDREKD